jgi:hypothetical protein
MGARPPAMKERPLHWPGGHVEGARPARAAIRRRSRLPSPGISATGHLGDQRPRDGRPDAGDGGEQILLRAPGGRTTDVVVDLGPDLGARALGGVEQAGDGFLQASVCDALPALLLGDDQGDDLPTRADEAGQPRGGPVGPRACFGAGAGREAGDHTRRAKPRPVAPRAEAATAARRSSGEAKGRGCGAPGA